MKKIFFVILLIFCSKAYAVFDICFIHENHHCLTSMIKIVANPKPYYGKKIAVHGVFDKELGNYVIFTDLEKYKIKSTVNAVELELDKELARDLMNYRGRYLSFRGTFYENEYSSAAGVLKEITSWGKMED
jgi:hypothetical protein